MKQWRILLKLFVCILMFAACSKNAFSQNSSDASQYGNFSGPIVTKWIKHDGPDRDMLVVESVTFHDRDGKEWQVPEGARINGASIPRLLWVLGSPFVGDYRRASVIHDHFCNTKSEPWKKVHRMLYDAVLTDGVSKITAMGMYAAVRAGGPRWERIEFGGFDGTVQEVLVDTSPTVSKKQLTDLVKWVESAQPTLDEIDAHIDDYASGKR